MELGTAVRESASYGKACSGCSKAKCRCILRGEGLSCERCHRLSKTCEPSIAVRKRLNTRPTRRTTRLEDRLDALVTLLVTRAEPGGRNASSARRGFVHPVARSPGAIAAARAISPASEPNRAKESIEGPTISTDVSPSASGHGLSQGDHASAVAEQCLETFRTHHLQAFPYFHITPSTRYAVLIAWWFRYMQLTLRE